MGLLWISLLLLVASCVSAVRGSPGDGEKEVMSIDKSPPLHIVEERNLMVLTPAGLTQMLKQTRFLMVLFRECPPGPGVGGGRGETVLLAPGARGVLYVTEHTRTQIISIF